MTVHDEGWNRAVKAHRIAVVMRRVQRQVGAAVGGIDPRDFLAAVGAVRAAYADEAGVREPSDETWHLAVAMLQAEDKMADAAQG